MLFKKDLPVDEIVLLNKKIISGCFSKRILKENYSEHPYIQYTKGKYKVDFVPAYKIKDYTERKTSVDRTPLHLKYLRKNLTKKQRDDVLILKKFLKNNLLYGSGQDINGFSGYLTELFILYFRDFENFVLQFPRIKKNARICLEKDAGKKYVESLIVIDPVDPERNVAAAMSKNNFERTKKLCLLFLKNQDVSFFFSNNNVFLNNTLVYKVKRAYKNTDILYGIANRKLKKIKKSLKEISNTGCYIDEKHLYLVFGVTSLTLPEKYVVIGPDLKYKNNVIKFKEKHSNIFIKNKKIFAYEFSEETDVMKIIEKKIKSEFMFSSKLLNKIKNPFLKKRILEVQGNIKL